MPIYDIICQACGYDGEVIQLSSGLEPCCPECGSGRTERRMAATSPLTGKATSARSSLPGPGDTACCGSTPTTAGCAGPGSCCGKAGQ